MKTISTDLSPQYPVTPDPDTHSGRISEGLCRASVLALLIAAAAAVPLRAGTTILNFDGLVDSTILSNQFAVLGGFSGAVVLSAGITLNEFEFPPHSGANVASDNGAPVTIAFSSPVQSFAGYFTYGVPLTVRAFGSTGNLVASASSSFSNNQALSGVSGSSPNELIQVAFPAGISKVTITGNPAGTSFVFDDATVSAFSRCDVNRDSSVNVVDLQQLTNEVLGVKPDVDDLNSDSRVSVVDVQIVINAVLSLGCSAS
jgi:hypothetical protein